MKYQLVLLALLLGCTGVFAQNKEWKVYSYAEFFERLMAEQDTAFTLSNAVIVPDSTTDSLHEYRLLEYNWEESTYAYNRKDTIHIYKPVYLNNVHFVDRNDGFNACISHVYFHENVQLIQLANVLRYTRSGCRLRLPGAENIFPGRSSI